MALRAALKKVSEAVWELPVGVRSGMHVYDWPWHKTRSVTGAPCAGDGNRATDSVTITVLPKLPIAYPIAPPNVNPGGTYTGEEGSPIALRASAGRGPRMGLGP